LERKKSQEEVEKIEKKKIYYDLSEIKKEPPKKTFNSMRPTSY